MLPKNVSFSRSNKKYVKQTISSTLFRLKRLLKKNNMENVIQLQSLRTYSEIREETQNKNERIYRFHWFSLIPIAVHIISVLDFLWKITVFNEVEASFSSSSTSWFDWSIKSICNIRFIQSLHWVSTLLLFLLLLKILFQILINKIKWS